MANFQSAKNRSKLVSFKNSIRICSNITCQPGREVIPYYVDINLIENSENQDIIKCGICSEICLCPIVFPCGHLICAFCYARHFKFHHYVRFNKYFTKCPDCSEFFEYSDALTLSQEIKTHPKSISSLFYQNAKMLCGDPTCNQVLSLYNWSYHMKFCCDQRIVKCPAIQCSFTGNPNDVMSHSVQCLFHIVWCAGCKVNWTVLSTGHNCERSKELRKLQGGINTQPYLTIPKEHGAVVLKNLSSSDKTPDVLALEEVEYLVSSYRYKSLYA